MDILPTGSITDVPGILVGHHQRVGRGWQTGTTAVMVPNGATPGVDVRGGGPGTRETDALAPENLIEVIHAICLTGGSAYGLAAADGVMAWLEHRGLGFPIGPPPDSGVQPVVPVVPAAVIFDLGRGGLFTNRPDASFGQRAAKNAKRPQQRWGSVGAGTGARAGGLQGGVGTASTIVHLVRDQGVEPVDVVVGSLAVVNANGTVIDPATALPWARTGFGLKRPATDERAALRAVATSPTQARLNTTIGVVATSARLTKSEASKMASVAHDGMARAIRPVHSMFDGDTIFSLATGGVELSGSGNGFDLGGSRQADINALLVAAADTFAAACTHAVLAATTVALIPAYRDLCPSALR